MAAAVFLPGCHLRCPYCHNRELVLPELIETAKNLDADMQVLADLLERRHKVLGGIAVSGGEALLHPLLTDIFNLARRYGLPVKLDTAGLLPERLGRILTQERSTLGYVAVDLKTELSRYGEIGWKAMNGDATGPFMRSLSLLKDSGIDYELRTTVVPPLVDETTLTRLDLIASKTPRWIWQAYQPGNTLDHAWDNLEAPDEYKLQRLATKLNLKSRVSVR